MSYTETSKLTDDDGIDDASVVNRPSLMLPRPSSSGYGRMNRFTLGPGMEKSQTGRRQVSATLVRLFELFYVAILCIGFFFCNFSCSI
jgi:hypothetical protein